MIVKSQIAFKPFRKDLDNIDVNQKSLAKQEHQNKFKTEFCRNLEAGFCEFGDKCFFAHSLEELREKNNQGVFKHIKCKNFLELKYCLSGYKCQYSHREISPEIISNSPYASTKASRKGSDDCNRASIFVDFECRSLF